MSIAFEIFNDCSNSEINQLLRAKQGKRLLATYESCKIELKNEIQLLFRTYYEALDKANSTLCMFPLYSRSRNLEASIVQTSFAESLFKNFSGRAFLGKYKRIILKVDGYVILFKKLNSKGYPMNIKTLSIDSILNQNLQLNLFSETNHTNEPILYFGYQKNRFGNFVNPQLIYIDESKKQFSIDETDFEIRLPNNDSIELAEVKPKLKGVQTLKQAN